MLTGFSTNLCCSTSTWPSLVFNNSFNHHLLTRRRIQHGRFSWGLSSGLSISFLANDTICYLTETTEAPIFISSLLPLFHFFPYLSETEPISCLVPNLCLFSFTAFPVASLGSGWLPSTTLDLDHKSSPPPPGPGRCNSVHFPHLWPPSTTVVCSNYTPVKNQETKFSNKTLFQTILLYLPKCLYNML